ncbi:hypothetical protein [Altibacter lentus]|uniref:hypothetical protein n=1 Tax=Altibacter lentus TaxID=1223410 RepID=UPI000556AFA2|nr:hypothetical protein [Altibacter lentus]
MKSKLILLFAILIAYSCSDNNDDDSNSESEFITLTVNNVYLENPDNGTNCNPDGSSIDCWRDLIITDGTYTQSSADNIFYPDNNTTYRINFLELQLVGDFSTPNTFEQLYNPNTDIYTNNGTEGIIFYKDIVAESGNVVSSTDLTETEGYVKVELLSENNFRFEIEMLDGTKYRGSYSGQINILDQEYSFAPFD